MQELISKIRKQTIKDYLGDVDFDFILESDLCLYYVFPLIERTVIEILKFEPESDIEIISQGKYRTLGSIISNNENSSYFDPNVLSKIKMYFGEDGIRNFVFHPYHYTNTPNITNDVIDDIRELCFDLIIQLQVAIESDKNIDLDEIEVL